METTTPPAWWRRGGEHGTDWGAVEAAFAMRLAARVPDPSRPGRHLNARRFTLAQLLACLLLKSRLGGTFRSMERALARRPAIRSILGLRRVPDFTTLGKYAESADPVLVRRLRLKKTELVIRFGQWTRRGQVVR